MPLILPSESCATAMNGIAHAKRQHLTAANSFFIAIDKDFETKAARQLLPVVVGNLAEDNDDVFDEVMNCGEDVRAALDGHSGDHKQREDQPGHETND